MEQNGYITRFFFIGLFALLTTLFLSDRISAQCIPVRGPGGQWTSQPESFLRCPSLTDPVPGTLTLTFQSPASNFTIDWGNGDIQTYPGPQTTVSYTYTTAQIFRFRISFPGCPDSLKGSYVNERNVTSGGVSVPGVGFIVPPAGLSNKRCVPEDLTIINGSPGMNGYTRWIVNWGDQTVDTLGNDFMRSYMHTYQSGTAGCSLQICLTYLNACGVNPVNRPRACYGDYFFKDIDSAAVNPASVILCAPTDVAISETSKLNCLDSADRQVLWTRTGGFANPLPSPGDNIFRPYTPANRVMQIPQSALLPIPSDSTYRLRMVIRNTCGDDSADAVIRIVSPAKPVFSVINNNTCPGEAMNFLNQTPNRPFQSYRVDFGDGTIRNMGFLATFSHVYTIGGTYTVRMWSLVNGYNGQTCSLSDSIVVQVKTTVTPIVQATPDLGCDTLTVRLENNSINTTGVVWRGWELGGSPLATAGSGVLPTLVNFTQMQVVSTNLSDSSAVVRFKTPGRYIIRLRAQSLGCPEISGYDTVDVYPAPVLRWRIPSRTICLGNSMTVRDSSSVIPSASSSRRGLRSNWNHISWRLEMGDGTIYTSASNITGNFNSVQGTDRLTSHTYGTPGVYKVKLTVMSPNRCPRTDSMNVTVLPNAAPAFTWSRDVCNPGQITLRNQTAGSSQRYEWIIRRGTTLYSKQVRTAKDTFDVSLPYVPPGDSTFYYITLRAVSGTSPDTCVASTAPVLIKIPPVKQAIFAASAVDGCTPLTDIQFLNQSVGFPTDGSHTYNWTFGNGNSYTGENPPLQNFINTGATFRRDTVRLLISGPGGCTYRAQRVITIYPMPIPQIVAPDSVCHNTSVTFSATGNGIGTYEWNFSEVDGTTSGQATPTRNFVNTGSNPVAYTIHLRATTVAGCSDTAMKTVRVYPRPTASFTALPEAACGASPVLFDGSTSIGAASYTWTFSDGTSGIQDTGSAVASRFFPENTTQNDRSYLVTLTTRSPQGCSSAPATRTVRIRPTVIASFTSGLDSACNPMTVEFTNLSSQTDDNYIWYVNELGAPGLGIPSGPNRPNRGFRYTFLNNSYVTPLRYVVTLVVRDDNGSPVCESMFSDTLTVLPKPLAGFVRDQVNPTTLCSPASMRFLARGTRGATSYTWNFSNGSPSVFASDSIPFFRTFFNNGTTLSPNTIELIVANGFGCTDTAAQTLSIRPRVTASFTLNPASGCSPLVSSVANTSSASSVGYAWYRDGIPVFFNSGLPPQIFENNSPTDTARYRLFLVTRGEGDVCTDTSSVKVVSVLPRPSVQVSASPGNGCSPLEVVLSAAGTTGGQQFRWYAKKNTESVFTLIDTRNNPNPFTHTITNTGSAAQIWNIKLVVSGLGSCLDSALTNVTVFPEVGPSFTPTLTEGCSPVTITFANTTVAPAGTSFIWKVDGVPQFDPTPATFEYTFQGTSDTAETGFVVTLMAQTGGGCSREVSRVIRVFPKPSPDFNLTTYPPGSCSPVSARFFPRIRGGFQQLTWYWDANDSLETTLDTTTGRNYFNGTASPETRTVGLLVKTQQGCTGRVAKTLTVNPGVRAGFSQSAGEGCSPLAVRFRNDGSSAGANVFEWLVDGIPVGTNPDSILQTFTNGSFVNARTYSVKLVAKNSFAPACTDTAARTVTIFRKPVVSASAFPLSGCGPLRTTLTASNSQGGVHFQWFRKLQQETSFTADTVTTSGAPFDRILPNSTSSILTYEFKVVVTGADGCKDSATVQVSVNPGLKASFVAAPGTEGCAPFSAVFANTTSSPAANAYSWLVDGVNVSNSPAFLNYSFENNSNTQSQTYRVQLVASNLNLGCPDTATRMVTVWPVPMVDVSVVRDPGTGCSPVEVKLTPANTAGADTYHWYLPDTLVTTQDSSIRRNYTNNTVVPQSRWISLKGLNSYGCSATRTTSFEVNPRVTASFLPSGDSLCSPASITFTNTSSAGANVAEWYINGVYKGNSLSQIAETFENNDSVARVVVVRLVVRNSIANACEDAATRTVTILPRPIAGSISANPENGCSPLRVQFQGSASFGTRYTWDFGDGTVTDTASQAVSHLFTSLNPVLNAQFTVTQTTRNAFGCQNAATTLINVRPDVTAGIVVSDTAGCSPLAVSLSGSASVNANSYIWNFGDGSVATGVNANRIFSNTGDTVRLVRIRLIADRSSVGCPDTAYVNLSVFPRPRPAFDASPVSGCQPLPVQFTNQSELAAGGYWVLTSGPVSDTLSGPALAGFDTVFTNTTALNQVVKADLVVASDRGCQATATRLITVSPFVNAAFVQSADSGCTPLNVNFTNLSAPGSASAWYVDGVLVNNASGQFSYSFINNTQDIKIFRVKLEATSVLNAACSDTLVRLVRVFPRPVAGTLGAVPDNGCSPVKISLFSNALGATRFLYDFNDGTIADTNTASVDHVFVNNAGLTTRNFNVRLMVGNAYGCEDQTSRLVSIKPTVTAVISTDDTLGCTPYSSGLSGLSSVNSNLYSWNFGDGTSSVLATPVKVFQNQTDSIQYYTVTLITDRTGVNCPDTTRRRIAVYPKPVAEFAPNPLVGCNPLPVQITNLTTGAVSASWEFSGNGNTVTTPAGAGYDTVFVNEQSNLNLDIQIRLTAVNQLGCTDTRTRNITVYPAVRAAFTQSQDSGCSPIRVRFLNQALPGNLVQWLVDGQPVSNVLTNFDFTFSNNGTSPRTFQIKQIARSAMAPECQDTAISYVTVYPKPAAGIINAMPEAACSPARIDFVGTAQGSNRFFWNFGDGSELDTTSQEVFHIFTNTNTVSNRNFRVRLVATNDFGCLDTAYKTVMVRPLVRAVIVSSDSLGCSPLTGTFSASQSVNANQFSWDFGNGQTSTLMNPSATFTNLSDTTECRTIRLITTRSGVECADTAYFPVCVHPLPRPDFTINPGSGCQPLQVSLLNQSELAANSTWQFISGGFQTQVEAFTYDTLVGNASAQIKTVRVVLTTTSNRGCRASLEKNFTVAPFVKADFAASADSGCSPLRVNFINLSSAGSSANWFVDGNPVANTGSGMSFTFLNNGTTDRIAEVMLVVRNNLASYCTDTIRRQIKIFAKPNAGLISATPESGCSPLISQLSAQPSLGVRYIWDFRDGTVLDSNQLNVTHTFVNFNPSANMPFQVRFVTVTERGCSDTTSKTLTVSPFTIARIGITDSVGCAPLTMQLAGSLSQNANRFTWDFGDGSNTSLVPNPIHTFSNTSQTEAVYNVRLIASRSGFSCPDTAYKTIRVFANPRAAFTASTYLGCGPLNVSFQSGAELADSVAWIVSGPGGTDTLHIAAASWDTTFSNPFPQQMAVRVEQQVWTSQGCFSSLARTITVNPDVKAEFTASADGCSPLSVKFTNLSNNPGGGYQWNFGDGSPVSSGASPTHIFRYSGGTDTTFQVTLLAISNPAFTPTCNKTYSLPVKVFGNPKPDFTITPGVLQLPEKTATFSNLTPYRENWTYQWSFGDGSVDTSSSLTVAHDYGNLVNELNNTLVKVKLIARNARGCTDSTVRFLEIKPIRPVVDFEPDTAGCAPLLVRFRNKSKFGNQYFWTFGDGTSSTEQNPSKSYQTAGVYSVSLRVTGPGGESVLKRDNIITVYDLPDASFTTVPKAPRAIKIPEEKMNCFVRYPQPGWSYEWDFGDGATSREKDPVHQYRVPGNYTITLMVTSAEGCTDSDTLRNGAVVEKGNVVIVPNAFTPRSDANSGGLLDREQGTNDIFYPFTEGVTEIRLQIFNRWGQFIYESTTLNKGWDGRFNGAACKADVYVYRIWCRFVDGKTETRTGDVTLLR